MLRGFRWQFVLFNLALVVFLGAAIFRLSRVSLPGPTLTATVERTAESTRETETPAKSVVSATNTASPLSTPQPSQSGAVYREALVGSAQRLNPLFAHLNPVDRDISSLIFEGLFATNAYGEVVPRLAAELIVSSDGLEYVVELRDDIKWQDGLPFTADDVTYTVSLLSDAAYSDYSPVGIFWQSVETQQLSPHMLRFRLAQPYSSFPHLLTVGILPEHALRGSSVDQLVEHPFNLAPVGTGAYQLAGLSQGEGAGISIVRLVLAPAYRERREAAKGYSFSELQFLIVPDPTSALQAYNSGQVDALANMVEPSELTALPQSAHYRQVESSVAILIFNWIDTPLAERRIRQALSLGLDVPEIVQAHLGAKATYADSPFVPGSSAYQPNAFWTTFDPAQARALLNAAEAQATEGEDEEDSEGSKSTETSRKFRLLIEDAEIPRSLAQAIIAQWQLLGLDFSLEPLESAEFRNGLETGAFDAAVVLLEIGADTDLFRFWHPAQAGKGSNYGAASNNELAELLEIARTEIYATRRALLHQQLQAVFADRAIAIPLFYPVYNFVVRDNIDGVRLGYLTDPADRFRGIQYWRPAISTS